MTSPGLKRPLDLELLQYTASSSSFTSGPVANDSNKRRCTQFTTPQSRIDYLGVHNNSPFKDSSSFLAPLEEDIATMIREEIHKRTNHDRANTSDEQKHELFTKREAQMFCEKVIKDRELKIRAEYDKILNNKLAEQHEIFVKYHIEKHYNESANGHPSALTTSHLAFNLQQQAAAATIQLAQQQAAAAAIHQQIQQQKVSATSGIIPSGPVLLSSNLDEQLATPEALFTLFGVFGDVIRVKILFNKKDNALIQMADANQAQVAQGYLDKQKIFGKVIRVTRSKHQLVQMPREGNQSDAGLTKDFTNSPLHRFKIPGSRNYLNIYPPSNTLHISNIPAIDEEKIQKSFKEACGFDYSSFKFFPKDRKMALMKFDSIEQATIALIRMHNFPISQDNNLRVSFSKSVMQQ